MGRLPRRFYRRRAVLICTKLSTRFSNLMRKKEVVRLQRLASVAFCTSALYLREERGEAMEHERRFLFELADMLLADGFKPTLQLSEMHPVSRYVHVTIGRKNYELCVPRLRGPSSLRQLVLRCPDDDRIPVLLEADITDQIYVHIIEALRNIEAKFKGSMDTVQRENATMSRRFKHT